MKAMNSLILIVHFIFSSEIVLAVGDTIVDDGFYGEWSTLSSAFSTQRQILKLYASGGKWIFIEDDGNESEYTLEKNDVEISDDLLVIDYRAPDGKFRRKLVLAGWGINNDRKIFGTVYLYSDMGEGLTLFNGIPIIFDSGLESMPLQIIWEYFSEPEKQRVDESYIENLEKALANEPGVSASEHSDEIAYSVPDTMTSLVFTKPKHPAHPAAIGFRQNMRDPTRLDLVGKYAGSKEEFLKLKATYENGIEELKRQIDIRIEKALK